MTFPGIGTSKKVEIMTTAESILIQNIDTQLDKQGSVILIKNGAGKAIMSIAEKHIIGVRFLNDITSMV